jgi:hypothetical protein
MAGFYKGFSWETLDMAPQVIWIDGSPLPYSEGRDGTCRLSAHDTDRVVEAHSPEALACAYIDRHLVETRDRSRDHYYRILEKGVTYWNQWRRRNPHVRPVLSGDRDLHARFSTLEGVDFSYTDLCGSNLTGVVWQRASFHQAILANADFTRADLRWSNFCRTDLYETTFHGAHLEGANLQGVQLARTDLTSAHLHGCTIYGMSVWDVSLAGADESDLKIRYRPNPDVAREEDATVHSLDLASFMHLTRDKRNISRVIQATNESWVLLLGRFTQGKGPLDALEQELRHRQFVPIIFDFPRPEERDLIETLLLLAGLSGFVIVEITDPKSTPLEMLAIASSYAVPIVPIMSAETGEEFGMFSGLRKFPWVRDTRRYASLDDLKTTLLDDIIAEVQSLSARLMGSKRLAAPLVPPAYEPL